MVDMIINRIERLENSHRRQNFFKGKGKSGFNRNKRYENCVHCSFLNKQLGSTLATNHNSNRCPKKKFSISFIESMDDNLTEAESSSASDQQEGGCISQEQPLINSLQINVPQPSPSSPDKQSVNQQIEQKLHVDKTVQANVIINNVGSEANDFSDSRETDLNNYADMNCPTESCHLGKLTADIKTLSSSAYD